MNVEEVIRDIKIEKRWKFCLGNGQNKDFKLR
jgi:hypothetical protein